MRLAAVSAGLRITDRLARSGLAAAASDHRNDNDGDGGDDSQADGGAFADVMSSLNGAPGGPAHVGALDRLAENIKRGLRGIERRSRAGT